MIYKCSICLYESNVKKDIYRHINRKKNKNCNEGYIINDTTIKNKKNIKCDICGIVLKSSNNLSRHKNTSRCNKNEETKKLKEKLNHYENIITNKHITINNIQNIQTIQNIHINNYSDNINISDDNVMYLVKSCSMMVPRFIESVYVKERRCMYIGDINRKRAYLYDNNKWKTFEFDDFINKIVPETEYLLFEKYGQIDPSCLQEDQKKIYDIASKMKEKYEKEYNDIRDNIINKELLTILYNNKNIK